MRVPLGIAFSFLSVMAMGQVEQWLPRPDLGNLAEITNEPFSADAITTTVRTLADGTHITKPALTVKMYRDSAGRTRSDRLPGDPIGGEPPSASIIFIRDPLAGYSYILDTVNKVAHRAAIARPQPGQPMNLPNPTAAAPTPEANASEPRGETEDLGTQTMEGLTVQGRRTTITYPAGSFGNDRDITNVAEIWSNSELSLMVLQVHSDPRNGETTTKLENLSRTQPDPNLFLPPPDYKIVDASAGQ
jgi:hypothetical protein